MWQTEKHTITPGGTGFGANRHRIHAPNVSQSLEGYNITIHNDGDIDLTEIQIRFEGLGGQAPIPVKSHQLKSGATATFSVGSLTAADNTNYIEVYIPDAAMNHIVDEVAVSGGSASFTTLATGRDV